MTSVNSITTVAQARDDLSRVLRRFRAGDGEPVVLGSHRRPEAVILPYESYIATRNAIDAPITPTLKDLRRRRHLILRLATLSRLGGVRVIGSVARGDATADSDIDLIVDPQPGASLLDLAQFADDLEQLLGRPVDVLSARTLDPITDAALLADAVPL
jgi:predicted nucleotidyltransferase